jgi:Uma2 family endonuclease
MNDEIRALWPGERVSMSWDEYEAIGEYWGEYVDGQLIAGPVRTGRHQDIVSRLTQALVEQLPRPLRAIHQWGWKAGSDEFIPDVMVFDGTDEDARLTTTPHLAVEVLSTDLATDSCRKAAKYAAAGLEHYWIVDPEGPVVVVNELAGGVLVETTRHGPGITVTLGAGTAGVTFDPADLVR